MSPVATTATIRTEHKTAHMELSTGFQGFAEMAPNSILSCLDGVSVVEKQSLRSSCDTQEG